MTTLLLLVALAIVTLGAELLVRSASTLALRSGVSSLFVGLTIVGFGTSTPELSASMFATLNGKMEVSVGNVVGSNIFNVAVILAITALIAPIRISFKAIRRDLWVAIGASLVLFLPLALGGVIPRWLGALMCVALATYIAIAFRAGQKAASSDKELAATELDSTLSVTAKSPSAWHESTAMHLGLILSGLGLLVLGARLFVKSAIAIAQSVGVPEDVIGLTIVSAGTSLPELVTSVVAARRGNPDIAVGNVIGSNIFNILGISGLCAVVSPQLVPLEMSLVDVPVMLVATALLVPLLRSDNTLSRREGGLLLVGYALYLTYLLVARSGFQS